MRALLGLTALLALGATVHAAGNAREILDRRRALENGPQRWEDRHERLRIRVVDRAGAARERELDIYARRFADDERKTIAFVLAPAEVRGTGLLAFLHKDRATEQWLYLPALKRIRQITAGMRSESFVGTDLTYRDMDLLAEMTSWSEADAASTLGGEEALDGVRCYRIELAPKREDIGYRRIVVWLGVDDLVPRQVELYDEEGAEPRKRIRQADVRRVGVVPVAHRMIVDTPRTGSHTEIAVTEVVFDQRLPDDLFSQRQLEKGGR
jgi:outer membrane lipoprotein-sorting protein